MLSVLAAWVALCAAPAAWVNQPTKGDVTTIPGVVLRAVETCIADSDCDRSDPCVIDSCVDGVCVHETIEDCVRCTPEPDCPPIEIVFVMDTSNSMKDEVEALCGIIDEVIDGLAAAGVTVHANMLGITEVPDDSFPCLSDNVVNLLGGTVPGQSSECVFPNSFSAHESWGPATAIVAERFPWIEDAIRVIVPIADEGPCDGSFPTGCNDPGDDRASIENAIAVSSRNSAIVFPITGTGSDECVLRLAQDLGAGTGGASFASIHPASDIESAILSFIDSVCPLVSPCDDGDVCTVMDQCDMTGVCAGTPIDTIPCQSDEDCYRLTCDTATYMCTCYAEPKLCLRPVEGGLPINGCFLSDGVVTIDIELGFSTYQVTGGQFLVQYDPTALDFLSVESGSAADPESPFGTVLLANVDEATGTIFYAVGVGFDTQPTYGPAIMARLRFQATGDCTSTELCFVDDNPKNTILSDKTGSRVPFTPCCAELNLVDGAPSISCPLSRMANADAGVLAATVGWEPVVAVDGCGETTSFTCTATHDSDVDIEHLIYEGGRFPSGVSGFECTATETMCGQANTCSWAVTVNPTSILHVTDVELAPSMDAGPFDRCIELQFYANCDQDPAVYRATIQFGFPFATAGHSGPIDMTIPAGRYACIAARDPQHTLTSIAEIAIDGTTYVTAIAGDPNLTAGGNWLVGGDLDGSNVIDILDFAIVIRHFGRTVDIDTTCRPAGFHADINADGTVDDSDMAFVLGNLYLQGAPGCCADDPTPTAIDEISVDELSDLGLGTLREADLNHDGLLNEDDIAVYLSIGITPPETPKAGHNPR